MTESQDYQQLSDDWRHRDQLTWQLPSVLVAISGALIAAVFQITTLETAGVRFYLLWGGLIFASLLTIALGQNLYFQTVAEDLMDSLRGGEQIVGGSIPRRRVNGPTFGTLFWRGFVKAGSTGLFLLSSGLTGFLGFLISNLQFQSGCEYFWWIGTGLFVVVLTTLINRWTFARVKQPFRPTKTGNNN